MRKVAKTMPWIANRIHEQLAKERAATKAKKSHRLALSQIGKCERDLWAGINGIPEERGIEGRILVLFDLGNAVEGHLIHLLRGAGFEVREFGDNGEQTRVVIGERASGRLDGEIYLELEEGSVWAVLETKSANAKKYNELLEAGSYSEWNSVYGDQAQIYMQLRNRRYALVIVECKDDSRLYCELIDLDVDRGVELVSKAQRIAAATEVPDRPEAAKSQYCAHCKWCDRNKWCWGPLPGVSFDDTDDELPPRTAGGVKMGNMVSPHEWVGSRNRWWQFWVPVYCKACYLPKETHPATAWRRARPIGDHRSAGEVMRAERLAREE